MDRGKRAHVRVAATVVVAVALAAALLSLPASAATTPNLTGSWFNVAAPTAPAWALQAGANLSQLSASWNGSAANGHAGLVGDANGLILNLARTQYSGRYLVTEGGVDFAGDMKITIVSANQITINLQGDNGSSSTLTFDRSSGSAVPPATSWCLAATAPSCESAPIPIAAGGEALEQSPDLTAGQAAATVSVSVEGDSPGNVDEFVPTRESGASRCVYIAAALSGALSHSEEVDYTPDIADELGRNYYFAKLLVVCVAYLHDLQGASAVTASASCPVKAFGVTVHSSGNKISFTPHHGHATPPLVVTCKRTATGLTVHVKSRSSHTSLKSLLGSRLLLGIHHRANASNFATVTAAFSNH